MNKEEWLSKLSDVTNKSYEISSLVGTNASDAKVISDEYKQLVSELHELIAENPEKHVSDDLKLIRGYMVGMAKSFSKLPDTSIHSGDIADGLSNIQMEELYGDS